MTGTTGVTEVDRPAPNRRRHGYTDEGTTTDEEPVVPETPVEPDTGGGITPETRPETPVEPDTGGGVSPPTDSGGSTGGGIGPG